MLEPATRGSKLGDATLAKIIGPHQGIACGDARETFLVRLFDHLWHGYRSRVSYVADYERVIDTAGAQFINDHIAFRTIATQRPLAGIASISRLFEAAGYVAAGEYVFPDKHLNAIHYQHANRRLPKLFISELKTWELPAVARTAIERTTASASPPVPTDLLAKIHRLPEEPADLERLVKQAAGSFELLPWQPPEESDLRLVNEHSQYGAWVLVHGYAVNHFTALVNSHQVETLDGIEKTVAALREAGVPLKAEIEGAPGSKLRQTATEAVVLEVDVRQKGAPSRTEWTYAYFELAERNPVVDPQTGMETSFDGFLGPQATQLFDMTKK